MEGIFYSCRERNFLYFQLFKHVYLCVFLCICVYLYIFVCNCICVYLCVFLCICVWGREEDLRVETASWYLGLRGGPTTLWGRVTCHTLTYNTVWKCRQCVIQTSKRIYIDGRRSSPNGQIPSQHTKQKCAHRFNQQTTPSSMDRPWISKEGEKSPWYG